jgi:hypothetical protein
MMEIVFCYIMFTKLCIFVSSYLSRGLSTLGFGQMLIKHYQDAIAMECSLPSPIVECQREQFQHDQYYLLMGHICIVGF